MHSFPSKAALAAIFVATALAGANAASMGTSGAGVGGGRDGSAGNVGRADSSAAANRSQDSDPNDTIPDGSPQNSYGTPTMEFQATKPHHSMTQSPRLTRIINELGAADHRINMDRQRGKLTATEARKLRGEAHAIRNAATTTANRHGGKLPDASYSRLQADIHNLNRSIHHFAGL